MVQSEGWEGPPVESSAILIVDDDPGVIRLLERTLRSDGFTGVESTSDPFDFLNHFDLDRPDLVILDLHMPGLSGHELLEELSPRVAPDDFLPRVVLTGELDIEPRQRALAAGATDFLTKPVDMVEIVLRVRNLLATRRLHQALLDEKKSLEDKVRSRTIDLRRAHEELVAGLRNQLEAQEQRRQAEEQLQHAVKVEALGHLAASVAHDFNNLLSVIMSFADFAAEEIGDDHAAAADVREIKTAARSGSMLTRQLLMFSRKEAARPSVVLPDGVITEMQGLLATALKGRHRLELDLSAGDARVKIDRGHLEQVLVNLTVNARDAMPETGALAITTGVGPSDGVEGEDRGAVWTCCVTDTGTGMPPEVRSKIFDPFFTTKGASQGTGLGLATTKQVIERAGGSIAVESEVGVGTTFRIRLPMVDAEPAEEGRPVSGMMQGDGEIIVVVAEEEALRRAMERTLSANGYTPIVVATGTEALEGPLANGRPPVLLITDVLAGDMSGIEVAGRCAVKTLFMSTYAEDVLHESSVLGPDQMLLVKPFEPADLLAHVRRMIDD